MDRFVAGIVQAALQAADERKPMAVMFGQVLSADPLQIEVEQRLPLNADQLILTHLVRDHELDITVDHQTEATAGGSGEAAFASHRHGYLGRKTITMHYGLKTGDKVILLRVQGGQQYIVLDRM